jgi:hypothetical protein
MTSSADSGAFESAVAGRANTPPALERAGTRPAPLAAGTIGPALPWGGNPAAFSVCGRAAHFRADEAPAPAPAWLTLEQYVEPGETFAFAPALPLDLDGAMAYEFALWSFADDGAYVSIVLCREPARHAIGEAVLRVTAAGTRDPAAAASDVGFERIVRLVDGAAVRILTGPTLAVEIDGVLHDSGLAPAGEVDAFTFSLTAWVPAGTVPAGFGVHG